MALAHFTDTNFRKEVLESELPVLVDFWAEWCGPCKMIAPVIEELAAEYAGKVKIGKIDVDQNSK
ncbi:MAG: thiol reductase thioredoxin, partial [Candidatus Omnitrophica bacterium]|nr:thiol reductase thioredoxin [Candidatus Omnitrophota bacterium]